MITLQSRIHVNRLGGMEIYNFLINPVDHEYQRWWPGTHLGLYTLRHTASNVGNMVYMDEFIGKRRVKMVGVVIEAEPGKKITWQLKKLIFLPIWLSLELKDDKEGVAITHTIRAGFEGIGEVFDAIFRVYFSEEFEKAMDEHVKTEFPKLRDLLSEPVTRSSSVSR
jgi:hypothetical protein